MPDLHAAVQGWVQAEIERALRLAGIAGASIDAANLSGLAPSGGTVLAVPSSAISGLAESIDDRVAALLVAGANVTLTYNDPANTLTIAAAVAGHTIADEGAALTQRATLNLTGPGVRATDNSGAARTDVTVNRWEPLVMGTSGTPDLIGMAGDVVMMERVS